ncbi:DUF1292 domain-containing protein [Clostridiaceae bacterium M8S5]|nr:DUF1292 domain-containing protein [Clostridiaceae bacterium M8S5]
MSEERQIHTFVDEQGKQHEFEILDVFKVDDKDYAILRPIEGDDEEEALLLRMELDENKEKVLVVIEDEQEFMDVRDLYFESEE